MLSRLGIGHWHGLKSWSKSNYAQEFKKLRNIRLIEREGPPGGVAWWPSELHALVRAQQSAWVRKSPYLTGLIINNRINFVLPIPCT